VKRPLRELRRGDVFRTADGRLWWLYAHGQPPYGRSWAGGVGREEDTFPLPSDESVEPLDLPALLARLKGLERENDFLRGQLSDLWQDREGAAVGAEAERGAVLALVMAEWAGLPARADAWEPAPPGDPVHRVRLQAAYRDGCYDALGALIRRVLESPDPCRPPVPPHRLEGALREVLGLLGGLDGGGAVVLMPLTLRGLLARVREALGEGS
jgi:hypothetical protein